MRTATVFACSLSLLTGVLIPDAAGAAASGQPAPAPTTVLEHLQSAHARATRDIEALSRYARKADDEGYAKVASLFRAGVKSRQVHLSLLDKAIRGAGSTPKTESLTVPEVKGTRDNLRAARDAAATERDKTLADAMSLATKEKNTEARKAFHAAREGLYELSNYAKDALADLDNWKKGKKDFYVCRSCGYLLDKLDIKKCPVDNAAKEEFDKLN